MTTLDPLLMNAVQAFRAGDLIGAEAACLALLALNPRHGQALHIRALVAAHTDRVDEALGLLDAAIAADPDDPSFPNTLGSLLFQAHRFAEAEPAFRRAAAINGRLPEVHGNLGNVLKALGRPEEALACYRRALELRADAPEMHHFLGTTLRALGRLAEAEAAFRAALALAPEYLEARHFLAEAVNALGRPAEAEELYRAVLADAPRFVPAHVGLAHALQSQHRAGDAVAAVEAAHALAPDHPMVRAARKRIHSRAVAAGHLARINDTERNAAYRAAVERAVTPDSLVLEIGTGSGLVALMAARAGAKRVVTCEADPVLARVAMETVARNGYGDRVSVVAKRSTLLTVGPDGDVPERADVLICDLTEGGLLSPGMLAVLQHARSHLVAPDARIIPRAATVFGVLVEAPDLARVNPVGQVEGFDLSAFDVFRAPGCTPLDRAADAHTPLSAEFPALDFDFTRDIPEEAEHRYQVTATAAGTCHGVAFWFDLALDEAVVCHSGSRSRSNHWKQALAVFPSPVTVAVGDALVLVVRYDADGISFSLA